MATREECVTNKVHQTRSYYAGQSQIWPFDVGLYNCWELQNLVHDDKSQRKGPPCQNLKFDC